MLLVTAVSKAIKCFCIVNELQLKIIKMLTDATLHLLHVIIHDLM